MRLANQSGMPESVNSISSASEVSAKNRPPSHLWEGESSPYPLFEAASAGDNRLKSLDQIGQEIAGSLQGSLTVLWKDVEKVEWEKNEIVSAKDCLKGLNVENHLVIQWITSAQKIKGYLVLDKKFFVELYNFLLGGKQPSTRSQSLTLLEQSYLNRVVVSILEVISHSWSTKIPWNLTSEKFLEEAVALENEVLTSDFIRICLKVTVKEIPSVYLLIVPKEILTCLASPSQNLKVEDEKQPLLDEEWRQGVLHSIGVTQVPVAVELGCIHTTLQKIIALKVEDVFSLDIPAEGHQIHIGGKSAFRGSLGILGENKAVKII